MERSESKYFVTAAKMDEAFIELLDEKCFEYITVKEICAKAGVNRSTFYLHYETINDLLKESLEYLDRQFLEYFKDDGKELVSKIPEMHLTELNLVNTHFLIPFLNYIKDHRRVFKISLEHPEVLSADIKYQQLYKYIVNPVMEKFNVPEELRMYYCSFYLEGMIAIIKEWLRRDCSESVPEIANLIESIVRR